MSHHSGNHLYRNESGSLSGTGVWGEFARYLVVGGVAFVCDYSVLIILTELARFNYLLSAVAGFVVGVSVNYLLCRLWVFRDRAVGIGFPFVVFFAIGAAGLGLTELILWFGVERLAFDYRIVKLIATAVVLVWNFGARKYFVFNGDVADRG